eukprot:15349488-Alexandrium_andersonii.AAC.1
MQRDWALRKAFDMVKDHASDRGTVECDWREREIKLRGVRVFHQERGDLCGSASASRREVGGPHRS